MQEVHDFLKKVGTYFLATIDGDQPRVRPFGPIHLFEDKLYIESSKKKDVAKQISANPKIELTAFDGQTWLRVAATMVEDNRKEALESLLTEYPQLRKSVDESTIVYYLKDATATFYSFTSEPRRVQF